MPMYGSLVTTTLNERSTALGQPLLDQEEQTQEDEIIGQPSRYNSIDHHTTIISASWKEWFFPHEDWRVTGRVGISPNNIFVQWFDRLLVVALFLTATVTVFLVCIVMTRPGGSENQDDNLNNFSLRLFFDFSMDLIFLVDFILGFFRAFREDGGRGRMVFDLREIQRIYVSKPGFTADLISSIPYDFLVFLGTLAGFEAHNLRFLRLIRLIRMHRGYRIVNQSVWYQQFTLRVDSRKLHMVQLVFGLMMVEHWASCWWVWLGREEILLERKRYTWIDRLEENGFIFDRNSELELYVVGLYWASTVSSSVGSGDIVPANPQEAIFVAMFQILGGCLFAYAVSSLVGLYAALHAIEDGRGAAIDAVNEMLLELRKESAEVDAEKIRMFVWQACDARAARARRRLAPGGALAQLSPQLRDEVFLAERQPWMNRIWFLRGCRPRLARTICREAKWVTYAPGDHVILTSDQCLVISRGVATTRAHILVRGSTIGIEGLSTAAITESHLKKSGPSFLCLNFVEALMFESATVERNVRTEGDPYEYKKWLRARVRYALLRWAKNTRKQHSTDTSPGNQSNSDNTSIF